MWKSWRDRLRPSIYPRESKLVASVLQPEQYSIFNIQDWSSLKYSIFQYSIFNSSLNIARNIQFQGLPGKKHMPVCGVTNLPWCNIGHDLFVVSIQPVNLLGAQFWVPETCKAGKKRAENSIFLSFFFLKKMPPDQLWLKRDQCDRLEGDEVAKLRVVVVLRNHPGKILTTWWRWRWRCFKH